jgi:hypothetical protein
MFYIKIVFIMPLFFLSLPAMQSDQAKLFNIIIHNKSNKTYQILYDNLQPNKKPQYEKLAEFSKLKLKEYFNLTSNVIYSSFLNMNSKGRLYELIAEHKKETLYSFTLRYFSINKTYENKLDFDLKDPCTAYTLDILLSENYNSSQLIITANIPKTLKEIALKKVASLVKNKKLVLENGKNIISDLYDEVQDYLKNEPQQPESFIYFS